MKIVDETGQLSALAKILSRGQFVTALQISIEMNCTKATAYHRLSALRERGCKMQVCKIREGVTGPRSMAYALLTEI